MILRYYADAFRGFQNESISDESHFRKNIPRALALLEMDCLGGSGSRGYGKVSFHSLKISINGEECWGGKPSDGVKELEKYAKCEGDWE